MKSLRCGVVRLLDTTFRPSSPLTSPDYSPKSSVSPDVGKTRDQTQHHARSPVERPSTRCRPQGGSSPEYLLSVSSDSLLPSAMPRPFLQSSEDSIRSRSGRRGWSPLTSVSDQDHLVLGPLSCSKHEPTCSLLRKSNSSTPYNQRVRMPPTPEPSGTSSEESWNLSWPHSLFSRKVDSVSLLDSTQSSVFVGLADFSHDLHRVHGQYLYAQPTPGSAPVNSHNHFYAQLSPGSAPVNGHNHFYAQPLRNSTPVNGRSRFFPQPLSAPAPARGRNGKRSNKKKRTHITPRGRAVVPHGQFPAFGRQSPQHTLPQYMGTQSIYARSDGLSSASPFLPSQSVAPTSELPETAPATRNPTPFNPQAAGFTPSASSTSASPYQAQLTQGQNMVSRWMSEERLRTELEKGEEWSDDEELIPQVLE